MTLWPKSKEVDPANAETGETKVGTEKTVAEQIAEGLKPFNDSIAALNGRFDSIESKMVTRRDTSEVVERQEFNPTSVLDDENVAFAQRLGPVMLRQLEVESRLVRADIQREYEKAGFGELWEQYADEIGKVLDGSPLLTADGKTFRGDPQYIRNVVDMVLGRHAREAGMRFDGKSKSFFLETAGGHGNDNLESKADGFSESQRKLLQKMGVPIDDAKKTMGKLQFV